MLNDMLFTLGGAFLASALFEWLYRRTRKEMRLLLAEARDVGSINNRLLKQLSDRNTDYRQALKTIDDLKAEIARRTPARCGGKFVSKRAA